MLLRDELACTVPNSLTPVSADFLAFMAARNAAASAKEANQFSEWLAMLDRMPGSFSGVGMDWRNFANPNPGVQILNQSPGAGNGLYGDSFGSAAVCAPTFSDAPEIVEMGGGPAWPVSPPPVLTTYPLLPPQVSPPPDPPPDPPAPAAPRPLASGNVCDDLRTGAVMQHQVSTEQLWACAQAGYQGAAPSSVALTVAGTNGRLPYLGTPDPSPVPAAGLSGVEDNTAVELLLAAAALAGLVFVFDQWPKMTRKRGR